MKHKIISYKNSLIVVAICTISACSSNRSPNYTKSYSGTSSKSKTSIPKVPTRLMPGGSGDNWRYLGATENGNLAIEINESSIANQQSNSYKYQDRKTIIEPSNFPFNGLPNYRYSLSWWIMNCDSQQYKITSTSLFDSYGKPIKNYYFDQSNYSNVTKGTISEKQYNYICNNNYRNIGY